MLATGIINMAISIRQRERGPRRDSWEQCGRAREQGTWCGMKLQREPGPHDQQKPRAELVSWKVQPRSFQQGCEQNLEKLESAKMSALKWVPSTPSEVHPCGFRYYQRVIPEVLFLLLFSSRTCQLIF